MTTSDDGWAPMHDDDVRATWSSPPVPEVGAKLPWWTELELTWLNKVVGPWRARRRRDPMPTPLTAEETARRLCTMPMSYWTYDYEPGVRHLGPMAQDFAGAFGLGHSNRQINMVDANGVAVVTMQVLNRRIEKLQREVARLSVLVEGGARDGSPPVSGGRQNGAPAGATVEPLPGAGPGTHEGSTSMHDENAEKLGQDDVEGHRFHNSDRTIKHDVQPILSDESEDDVQGHRFSSSDRNIKHDVQPVASEEDDDVEGDQTNVR